MKSPFRAIENHRSGEAKAIDWPWNITDKQVPTRFMGAENKEARKKWEANPLTEYVFYSAFEGIAPSQRVLGENEPKLMHGFVADYDNEIDQNQLISDIEALFAGSDAGRRPQYVSKTPSGGARAVWVFPSPVRVTNKKFFEAWGRLLRNELRMDHIHTSFDATCLEASRYYSLGHDWVQIPETGTTIPASEFRILLEKAHDLGREVQTNVTYPPLEKIRELVDEAYPGAWPDEIPFEDGQNCPAFWLGSGATQSKSEYPCVLHDQGLWIFSDTIRSQTETGDGMIYWDDIIPAEKLRKHTERALDEFVEDIYFDGKQYWSENLMTGEWWGSSNSVMVRELNCLGLDSRTRKGKPSEVDQALRMIEQHHRIAGAGPVLFQDKGTVVATPAGPILNTRDAAPISPSGKKNVDPAKDFPLIWTTLANLFEGGDQRGHPPLDYFLSWAKHTLAGALAKEPNFGQALYLIGPSGSGKTFLTNAIIAPLFGGGGDAQHFLTSGDKFNEDLAGKAIWLVDDAPSAKDSQSARVFVKNMKSSVANPKMRVERKFGQAFNVDWMGRIVVTLNNTEDSLHVVPQDDRDLVDKFMAFHAPGNGELRAALGQQGYAANNAQVLAELPHFAQYLVDYEIPELLINETNRRFLIHCYHHDLITQSVGASSMDSLISEQLRDFIRVFAKAEDVFDHGITADGWWSGTVTTLCSLLRRSNGGQILSTNEKRQWQYGLSRLAESTNTSTTQFLRKLQPRHHTNYYALRIFSSSEEVEARRKELGATLPPGSDINFNA